MADRTFATVSEEIVQLRRQLAGATGDERSEERGLLEATINRLLEEQRALNDAAAPVIAANTAETAAETTRRQLQEIKEDIARYAGQGYSNEWPQARNPETINAFIEAAKLVAGQDGNGRDVPFAINFGKSKADVEADLKKLRDNNELANISPEPSIKEVKVNDVSVWMIVGLNPDGPDGVNGKLDKIQDRERIPNQVPGKGTRSVTKEDVDQIKARHEGCTVAPSTLDKATEFGAALAVAKPETREDLKRKYLNRNGIKGDANIGAMRDAIEAGEGAARNQLAGGIPVLDFGGHKLAPGDAAKMAVGADHLAGKLGGAKFDAKIETQRAHASRAIDEQIERGGHSVWSSRNNPAERFKNIFRGIAVLCDQEAAAARHLSKDDPNYRSFHEQVIDRQADAHAKPFIKQIEKIEKQRMRSDEAHERMNAKLHDREAIVAQQSITKDLHRQGIVYNPGAHAPSSSQATPHAGATTDRSAIR